VVVAVLLVVVGPAGWQLPTTTRPTSFHSCKTRGC
jgi:hypothetical protein